MTAAPTRPVLGLRGPFVQSYLASSPLRRRLNKRRRPSLEQVAQEHILDAGDGVRLAARLSTQPTNPRGTVLLLHGWEGSHDSVYLHSLGSRLFDAGYSVARLNLRDHGGTHHLNPEPFHSARMQEVYGAVRALQELCGAFDALVGFSLGGNFSLRLAIAAQAQQLALKQVIAVNPVMNPETTTRALDSAKLYLPYFLRKWRQTIAAKRTAWPKGPDYADLLEDRSLLAVTDKFATRYCGFASRQAYFAEYTLGAERFTDLCTPTTIISSADDALIPISDIRAVAAASAQLHIREHRYGGHCGYVKNWRLESWLEPEVLELLAHPPD